MAKQQILLVDADSSSARLLEVSLRSAGFTVAVSSSAESALAKLEHGVPDLILTDTRLPGADGFAFVQKLRARSETAEVPVVFLTEHGALDDKLRGLELGVDDYLAKPIMVREVVTRVQLLLARKRQQRIAVEPQARTRFSGSLEDVAVVDLLQTIAVSGKSGVASVKRGEREAWLYFDRGQIIDAEVGDLEGEEAVYRTLTWTTGTFDLEFRAIERPRVIEVSPQALLMEGLRRVDELGRIAEQLPPEHAVVDIDHDALASRLHEIPDELNGILRLIDGKRTLVDLIDASPFDDLSTLTVLSKFYFEGLLRNVNPEPVEWAPGSRPVSGARRESSPPASGAATPSAPTLVPPSSSRVGRGSPLDAVRLERAPSSPVATLEPPREPQRFTPAAVRAAFDPDAKLLPKGIVNVGDPKSGAADTATPSRAASRSTATPLRSGDDAPPRRSPIPMPGGALRANGASSHGATGAHTDVNGGRPSRTMYGLAAAPQRGPGPFDEPGLAPPPGSEPPPSSRRGGDASRALNEGRADDARTEAPQHADDAASENAPARPAPPSEAAAATGAPSSVASDSETTVAASGSNPESEREFFEAGEDGTYAGGPSSSLPVPHRERDSDEGRPVQGRHATPSSRMRAQRNRVIVAAVLILATAPLAVGAWRHFSARSRANIGPETATGAPRQFAPETVKQPGNTGPAVAPNSTVVSSPGAAVGADAATPVVPDGSAALGQPAQMPPAVSPSSSEGLPPASTPQPAVPMAPNARPLRRDVSPASTAAAPRAPTRPTAASPSAGGAPGVAQKAPNSAELPFIPPFEAAPAKAEPRPGEKPPTAAYPLR